jgi:predicted outer membrane protein
MQNNKVLKRLLTVATVAAMFSAFGVHAQTSGSSGTTSASGSGQDATTATGKTTREGTAGNTNSAGKDERAGGTQGSTQGSSSQGAMGSSTESAANPAVSGTSQGSAGAGAATREGTVGNTNSQGMESRQPSKAGSSSGTSSGSSQQGATSGSSGMSSGSSGQGATAGGAAAAGASKGSVSKADEKIIKDMAMANIAEIETGKIAQSKSQNDQVKSFAQQMIDDHSKALSELQTLAQQKGVTLPTEPDSKHKAMATKLQAMSGDAFDKAYMAQAGVSDHKKVHSMLMSDEKRAKDPDVKAAAAKMAPVVEQHLKSAEQMHSTKSGTTSGK